MLSIDDINKLESNISDARRTMINVLDFIYQFNPQVEDSADLLYRIENVINNYLEK